MNKYDMNYEFTFGKHKGSKVSAVILEDISYVIWCITHHNSLVFSDDVIDHLIRTRHIPADDEEIIHLLENNNEAFELLLTQRIINLEMANKFKYEIVNWEEINSIF